MVLDYILAKIHAYESNLFIAVCCATVYFLLSKEQIKDKIKSTTAGFISGVVLAPMIADVMSDGNGVVWYVAGVTLCGQFVPQLIQSVITSIKHTDVIEFVKRFFKR